MQTTLDAALKGKVLLEQPAAGRGYRFNEDSVLLADFAARSSQRVGHLIDLGAGVGVIALCVAQRVRVDRITLIDVDEDACALARANCQRAGIGDRAVVVRGDVATWRAVDAADLIVVNPPYSTLHAGRQSPNPKRDRARRGGVEPFLEACARALAPEQGRVCICYPAPSMVPLLRAARDVRLHAVRCAWVHATADEPARIALVEFKTRESEFVVEGSIIEESTKA